MSTQNGMSSQTLPSNVAVAVLFQAIEPPIQNGVRKPRKPNGYTDSGADIAYTLQQSAFKVLTPKPNPDPSSDADWCFPDSEEGILSAIQQGATHLWANTVVFSEHPLQTSTKLQPYASQIHIVGQPPKLVDEFDDKAYLNDKLRVLGSFTLPQSWLVQSDNFDTIAKSIEKFPVIAKPVRGRGSQGVKLCHDLAQLKAHVTEVFQYSTTVLIEDYLAGEEGTITVMPPSPEQPEYRSLRPVTRFNHINGVAPYNGVVAVTANSRAVRDDEMVNDPAYHAIMDECRRVAELIQSTAPIRIDIRRFEEGSKFALFDINMKPNMTGPGRPGRDDQDSLCGIAAAAVGWDYAALLQQMLHGSKTLAAHRAYKSGF